MMEHILEGLQEAASFLAALEPAPAVPMTAVLVLVIGVGVVGGGGARIGGVTEGQRF